MNLSLMFCQMMRVISSPSSSTMGFLTLIFWTAEAMVRTAKGEMVWTAPKRRGRAAIGAETKVARRREDDRRVLETAMAGMMGERRRRSGRKLI